MTCCTTIGIDDNLAPGQAGIAHRASDHKGAGRVDVVLRIGHQPLAWQHGLDDMLHHSFFQFLVVDFRCVLGG